jgi:signal transduction histidine kinase
MRLGLYVVREIVAAHHGTINVQSAPHQGTTFTITLPLVAADARCEHYNDDGGPPRGIP